MIKVEEVMTGIKKEENKKRRRNEEKRKGRKEGWQEV
jgi:hypothetical protein